MTYGVLHTARLVLRPPQAQDAEFLVRAMNDRRVWEWLSVIPNPYTHQDAKEFIDTIAAADQARIIEDADGPVGVIGCSDTLGYWLIPEAWGRGYITEAGDAVVDWFFETSVADQLLSGHFDENHRSRRALEKLGFVDAGPKLLGCVSDGRTDIPSRHMEMSRARWQSRRVVHLQTPRLQIRNLAPQHAGALQRNLGVPEVARNMISIRAPWTDDQVARFIMVSQYRGRPGFRLGIFRGDALIGVVGMGPTKPGKDSSVMYALDPAHWGQGYATEAMQAFLSWIDAEFAPKRLEGDYLADNPTSGQVLRKLGFVPCGEYAEHIPTREGAQQLIACERLNG